MKFTHLILCYFFVKFICHIPIVHSYYDDSETPTYITVSVASYAVLNCNVDFPQSKKIPYYVIWRKDNNEIFSWQDGIIKAVKPFLGRINFAEVDENIIGHASINLTSIRSSDEGWYECVIVFPNRTPSTKLNGTWVHLTVNGGDLLSIPPVNETILEGDEVQLLCATKDPNYEVHWYKDGKSINSSDGLKLRTHLTENHTLVIQSTHMSDIGEYSCEVVNPADGHSQTAKAFVNVQYKAKVVYSPKYIYLPHGEAALIDCHFRSNPPLTNLRWEKDGFLYDPYNIQGVFYRRNGSLYFTKVDESHSGEYTCTPFNDLGSQGPSPPITVLVQKAPEFTITPHNMYLKKKGETVQMPCEAQYGTQQHKADIFWTRKDGNELPKDRFSQNLGNLTITDIKEGDEGIYICSATNRASSISAETELKIEKIFADVPYNLTVFPSSTSVRITWLTNDITDANTKYYVWYKEIGNSVWETSEEIPSTSTNEMIVENLKPGHSYEFMVLGKKPNALGIFSQTVKATTNNINHLINMKKNNTIQEPLGPPQNVTVYSNQSGLLISWDPPQNGHDNLKTYMVRWYRGQNVNLSLFDSILTENTTYFIEDQFHYDKDSIYNIQVIAISFNGDQSVSRTVIFPGLPNSGRIIQAVSNTSLIGFSIVILIFFLVIVVKMKLKRYLGQS